MIWQVLIDCDYDLSDGAWCTAFTENHYFLTEKEAIDFIEKEKNLCQCDEDRWEAEDTECIGQEFTEGVTFVKGKTKARLKSLEGLYGIPPKFPEKFFKIIRGGKKSK